MPLNLSVNDGDFTPYIKYNAKAGRWYVKVEGNTNDIEVINPRLAFDMVNIKTGWLFYAEGAGPEKVWDPSNTRMADRPLGPRKFKRGFEVMVYGNDDIPGIGRLGLREFSSTASNVIAPILEMHRKYEESMAANAGKVPFFACTGVTAISGHYGTNYEPLFDLIGWVERTRIPAFDETSSKASGPDDYGAGDQPAGPADDAFPDVLPPAPAGGGDPEDTIPF